MSRNRSIATKKVLLFIREIDRSKGRRERGAKVRRKHMADGAARGIRNSEGNKGSKRYICTYTDTKILATDVQERKKR